MKSMIMAFSTYSKLPVPRVAWDEKNMRYSMCFFPLVGAVIGGCSLGTIYILGAMLELNAVLVAAVLTALPLLITGGIHMDGFLDTVDAKNSYKSTEEKLKILKDPHTGAFAIIFGTVYLIVYFGFVYETVTAYMNQYAADSAVTGGLDFHILGNGVTEANVIFALSFVYVRILSALSVVTFRKAKREGMAAETARNSDGHVRGILICELLLCGAVFLLIDILCGAIAIAAGLVSFFCYRNMAYRTFGGITGDLAGYFLQKCELMILVCVVLAQRAAEFWEAADGANAIQIWELAILVFVLIVAALGRFDAAERKEQV